MSSPRSSSEQKAEPQNRGLVTSPAIKNLLTCPIRLELFFAPVTLGCGHSVEQDTLPALKDCPLCRKPIPHGFEADINVVIKSLVIETIRADKSLLTDQYFSIDIWKKILKKETSYEFLAELLAAKELDACWILLETELEWFNRFNDGYFLKIVDEVINRNPLHVFALAIRAVARNMKNDFDGAIADATEALRLNPNYAAFAVRAAARHMKKDFDGAIADATSALRLNPNNASALRTRAAARRMKNDFDEAIADATSALKLNPNDAFALGIRAAARRLKKDFDGAIADATSALKLNPNDASALRNRADARRMKNDFDGAIADATSALKLNPNDEFTRETLMLSQNEKKQLPNQLSVSVAGLFAGGVEEKNEAPKNEVGVQKKTVPH